MGSLLVVLIILGCIVYLYLKGTLVRSFAMVIISICASVVSFGYFEFLANILVGREMFVSWAHSLSFMLLFILVFALLQIIAIQLTYQPINLGFLPERIGRVICGILLGLIVSGVLLTTVAMAPVSAKYPYQRFDETNPDPENPAKVLLNADEFATGWFSIISSGSFSGKRSFAILHPAFLDQLFLNRHEIDDGVSIITIAKAIEIPKKAVWPAPEGLKDSDGKPIPLKSGHNLMIVRVGITYQSMKMGGVFTPSQLRLVCKQENGDKDPLTGKGRNIYPVGYLESGNQLQIKKLTHHIKLGRSDFTGKTKEIDFAFYVPEGYVPVLFELKQNSVSQLPPPITADQAPPAVPFTAPPEPTEETVEDEDTANDTVVTDLSE